MRLVGNTPPNTQLVFLKRWPPEPKHQIIPGLHPTPGFSQASSEKTLSEMALRSQNRKAGAICERGSRRKSPSGAELIDICTVCSP
ncbi:hypothetical protein Y1Q_0005002 [Alligator mississippiensis]|uniref:Uncharacterized protein n=1 Tax=Alligator mississippiensis TaxID=8496 RepID=A0A151PJH9_ALLMI|nr:hypothetical protein Y1Q_0005002 [Alligator mississippiensis]